MLHPPYSQAAFRTPGPLWALLWALLWAGSALAAAPDEGPSPGTPSPASSTAPHAPPPAAPQDAAERLESALRSYHSGQRDLALTLLTALVRDEPEESEVVSDARILMGEIFLAQGNEAAARGSFELVLLADPSTELDPFVHPPDICAFFELVKASGSWRPDDRPPTALPDPVAPARPSPWLPLGVAQYRQQRPVAGTLFAITQSASCGLSAGLFAWMAVDRRYDSTNESGFDDDNHRLWTLETLQARRAAQWTLTGACYTAYGLGVTDAWLTERRARRQTRGDAAPDRMPAVAFQVSGRF